MIRPGTRWSARAAAVAVLMLVNSSCRTSRTGEYVWFHDIPAPPAESADPAYRIAYGDVLAIRVWNQDSMSTRTRVRTDGRIAVPFLQDLEVAGMSPDELSLHLQAKLKAFIVNPVVTVTLEERAPLRVSVVGEVGRPGALDVAPGVGLLPVLAAAGGLTDYANRNAIFVIRGAAPNAGAPGPERIRFSYEALVTGNVAAARFRLRNGDVVVVE
jgi:polysaccharide export outer membrane protein